MGELAAGADAALIEKLTAIHALLPTVAALLALLVGAILVYLVVKHVWMRTVRAVAERSSLSWDKELIRFNVFGRFAQAIPALIVFSGVPFVPGISEGVADLLRNIALGYIALMITMALSAMLAAAHAIYAAQPVARERPIRGFVQTLQMVVWLFGGIVTIAAVLDRSPMLLISGLGAMTAILLLLFKDTILSLVSSIQLAAQDMVRVGDWIEMPQFDANGEVVDVQLHTVKVQNWDKTITMLPTDRLIVETFKNWRGMRQSGGRRIKRAILIDVLSIRRQTEQEVEHFTRFALLKEYIEEKKEELAEYNAGLEEDVQDANVNRRCLTNIGTFRAYAFNYLKNHPSIRDDMMIMVRQLAPGPHGVPIEIYCFVDTIDWVVYEGVQSDVFDHLLAIVPEFGLKIFQTRTGVDAGPAAASDATAES